MLNEIQLIPVFIGSPSGLEQERRSARSIVEELNRDHSRNWGCMLELVGWEETLPGHGRPQELINKDLDRCEYFIGVLYDHWGSSTATGDSQYSSGFEEEYERAKSRLSTGEMKDMAVYFKGLPADRKRDPGPSLQKVIKFRESCYARKDALYSDFANLADFESLVRAKLCAIGWIEYNKRNTQPDSSGHVERPKKEDSASRATKDKEKTLLSASTGEFLEEMIKRSSEWEETSAVDVARLRLIGSSISRSGNDKVVLGNHDANLLFLHRLSIEFSSGEIHAQISSGIEGFRHQNVPLWYWLSKNLESDQDQGVLRLESVIGKGNRGAQAIRLMMLLSLEPIELGDHITREKTLIRWLQEDTDPPVFEAGVNYLQRHGRPNDIPTLEECFNKTTSHRKSEIGQSIISIEAKLGESHALSRALDLGIDEVNDDLCQQLFSKPTSLTTELLTRCLLSAANKIRRQSISILNQRNEIAPSDADGFLSDPDYCVRYFAAEALHSGGSTLDEDVAKKALTKVKKQRGLTAVLGVDTDTEYFDLYRSNRLAELNFKDLKDLVDRGGVFDEAEAVALFKQHTRRVKAELRTHLKGGFSGYFRCRVDKLRSEFGREHETVLETEKIIPFLKRCLLTAGTEALAGLKDKNDLELMRHVIDSFEVDVSIALLEFLGRFGDWSDIDRVVGLEEYSSQRVNTLLVPRPTALPHKASAILTIAKKRIADLLDLEMSVYLRRSVLQQLQRKAVVGLSDEVILKALNEDDDESRILMALKCCEHLPKKRLQTLLDRYTKHDEHRYYNSIHWLDMGVSMSRETARSVAQQELASRV